MDGMDRSGKRAVVDLNTGTEHEDVDTDSNGDEHVVESNNHGQDTQNDDDDVIVDDIDVSEVMQMTFGSEDEAYDYYNLYGKSVGFSIRRADVKAGMEGRVRYRKFVCSREGKRDRKVDVQGNRKRQQRPETRVMCPAFLRIKYDKSMEVYVVTDFEKEHNHKMANKNTVRYLRSHRKVTDADYAQASTMKKAGVKISQIMKYFALQSGGYCNVGFSLKDLYNRMDLENRKEVMDGDAESAVAYFTGRKATDVNFAFEYELDAEGRLNNIFWADAKCREDYASFGDVLVFDSTYNTNEYHKPLVVLAGVNNHFATVVFGTALVSEETIEAYEWVLNTLINCMGRKMPISVLTDGDKSMKRAIENVLPDARHRLCSWHLAKNAEVNSKKCQPFMAMFGKFMKKAFPIEEMDEEWHAVVGCCGLEENEWVKRMYRKRTEWAESMLRGSFFAGMRSTQRCENMNAFLKRYVKRTMKIYEFVKIHAFALDYLREKEVAALHETEDTFLRLATEVRSLEKHASQIYTRKLFLIVVKHLSRQGLYDCYSRCETRTGCMYSLKKYRELGTWNVEFDRGTQEMKCSCKKFEWKGVPCAHMFRVMVMENMQKIPRSLIMKRWTRCAKAASGGQVENGDEGLFDEYLQEARFGTLMTDCREMCYFASHLGNGFYDVRQIIQTEKEKWRNAYTESGMGTHGDGVGRVVVPVAPPLGIRDPVRTVAKGDHIQKERAKNVKCGKCGMRDGHNARTCPKVGGRQQGASQHDKSFGHVGLNIHPHRARVQRNFTDEPFAFTAEAMSNNTIPGYTYTQQSGHEITNYGGMMFAADLGIQSQQAEVESHQIPYYATQGVQTFILYSMKGAARMTSRNISQAPISMDGSVWNR